ncbi:MAG: TrbI/VirB10 family protein [Alphaproteobacteria bacterium]|nr:TrbI/VirB10 family protein [Alphaproteobacteria bacterium]
MADDNTPGENPFDIPAAALNGNGNGNGNGDEALREGAPEVAARNGKTFIVLGLVIALVLFLLYSIFSGGKSDKDVGKVKQLTVAPKSIEPPPLPIAEPPPLAPPPSIVPPSLPEPLQVPQTLLAPKDDGAAKAQEMARLRSTMLVKDGGSGGGLGGLTGGGSPPPPTAAPTDPNSQFAANLATTKTERVEATRIGDLRRTIAQGRIIQATMESALNTDLPAPIRAIVSRDTYAEAGTVPLIPKGSRLIGSYNTTLTSGQTRVFVIWTRVIRPDGVDVALDSPLVDGIGQAGVTGQIDTKFQEIFSRSLLSSVMNIALAIGSDSISGGSTTSTSNGTGSTTTGDAATTATTNALNRLGSLTDGFIQRFLGVQPTILVDQGTVVNVFVNKDLVFPEEAVGARIIN